MGRIDYIPVAQIKKTADDLIKRWPLMLFIILIDIIFLTVFSFVYTLYFQRIMSHAAVIMQQTPAITSALQSQDIYAAAPIAQALAKEVFGIKILGLFLALSVFVIWIAFQAFNWWNAFRTSGRKISYVQYLKSFSLMSAIWVALVSIILYISIEMFFGNALALQGAQPEDSILNAGLIIAFGVIGYFALVSYSLAGKVKEVLGKTITFSFLKSQVLVAYIFILIAAVMVNFILFGLWAALWSFNDLLVLAIGAIFVLFLFAYGRVYMINVVQELEIKKRKN